MTLRPIADPDFWWHLRTGKLITETGIIPSNDPFSYTKVGEPWIAHEWLSEIIIYWFYQVGGYGLLIFVFSMLITVSFLLVYLRCQGRPYGAGIAVLLAALASAPTWGVRPQMISLFLTSVFLHILESYREKKHWQILIPLPIITLLWVNLHAGYILGFSIIGIYLCSGLLEIVGSIFRKEKPIPQPVFALTVVLITCALAALANPNIYEILVYPFETLTSNSMMLFIQEWFSPDFHQPEWAPLAILILTLIVTSNITKQPVPLTHLLLTAFFGFSALRSMRHVPLFALTTVSILSTQLSGITSRITQTRETQRFGRWLNHAILLLFVVFAFLRFTMIIQQQAAEEEKTYPEGAVAWILENKPVGKIYNTYGWGGYLIWRLYPEYLVYIDGRADLYGDEFIYDYLRTYNGQPALDIKLKDAGVKIVLVEPDSGLAYALENAQDWVVTYKDELSVLYIKK